MGKPTGFIELQRVGPGQRPVSTRLGDWNEVYVGLEAKDTAAQGGRCMDCGVPFCQQGCPLGNHIPDWNDRVYRGRWREAYERLAATNNFPEVTGRLCPAPCEAACVLAINDDAVTIEEIEKQIIERAFSEGWVMPARPRARTGKTVAVVGSGPAGLAAAVQLRSVGHEVTVYEADDRLGGMLRYGIPDFKMEKWVIDRRIEVMRQQGIVFETGVRIGEDLPWTALREGADAVLIAVGAQAHRDLELPGRELSGVCFAMDYLTRQNRVVAGDRVAEDQDWMNAAGRDVIILGGGDTGSDCLGTALRQGARSVRQIQLWPAPPKTRAEDNPWPQWPLIFRVSTSQKEGGERDFAMRTVRLCGADGKVSALETVGIEVVEDNGARKMVDVPGSEAEIPADLVILAIGFEGPKSSLIADQLGATHGDSGTVAVNERYATSIDGVFCAGDAMRGASLIVWAIADGREAARHMDAYLRGTAPHLPTRGMDCAFGGK